MKITEDLGENHWPLVENKKEDFLRNTERPRASKIGPSFSSNDNFVIDLG